MKIFPQLFLIISILLTTFSCVTDDEERLGDRSLPLGSEMPAFEVTMSDGSRVSNRDLAGTVAVIVLFNTSCPDCRAELPVVQEVSTLTGDNVRYLCIARGEEAPSIAAFWREHSLTLPYSPQPDNRIYSLFAESVIPRVMIFDTSGRLTASFSDSPIATVQMLTEAINNASEI